MTAILRLVREYQPIEAADLDMSISKLYQQDFADCFFLARQTWCDLFEASSIYEKGGYANLCWLVWQGIPGGGPVIALFLHIEKIIAGRPWGSVTLLDYSATVRDVITVSELPPSRRKQCCKLIAKRYTRNAGYCSMWDTIRYLKTGEVN